MHVLTLCSFRAAEYWALSVLFVSVVVVVVVVVVNLKQPAVIQLD